MGTATFEAKTHTYQYDGIQIPSVTQVLSVSGLDDVSRIPFYNLEKARQVGEAVHEATQLLDEQDLEVESLDPQIIGYIAAYRKFREENPMEWDQIEHRHIGELAGMRYGMCVDRLAHSEEWDVILVDIKTASRKSPTWQVQTAAYAIGLGIFEHSRRFVVHLAKNGTYKLIAQNDARDAEIWECALRLTYWRLQNGVKIR